RFFEYEEERRRGFDYREDLWHPVTLFFTFEENGTTTRRAANLIASTSPRSASDIHLLRKNELTRRGKLTTKAGRNPVLRALARAADQFLVARGDMTTVIAGYPWFSDWGRDSMIALPGLTLATGRPEVAKEILLAFLEHVDQGMLPNRFPDAGEEPEYNTVDATLWYFEAVRQYVEATGDLALVGDRLFRILADIVAWHERGTRYGIRVSTDGLLEWHAAGEVLTWMDARVAGRPVTPREGKPVEIQALWFSALKVMENLAKSLDEPLLASRYRLMAARAKRSFSRQFWNATADCLYDVVDADGKNGAIRPNQLFAISLFHSMLTKEKAKSILAVVARELLTPYGLRTLSPKDPAYRGRYEGGPEERDAAYHQGTVWPWLLGAYATAFRRANGEGPKTAKAIHRLLAPLGDFVLGDGLGQLPEIFDGDAPHRPRGCVAQAWSVAELLRAAVDEKVRKTRE
ncbi:MAG: amylo-alpha-1,6-glucosidase, partial [Thermoanaerobaculia bacterium]